MNQTSVQAIVVTYNSSTDLAGFIACEPLLAAFSRIVVVDNGSTDDTVEMARTAGLQVVELSKNVGFGAAANVGVSMLDSAAVCVLNPDIRLSDEFLPSALAEHFEDPTVALVAPALYLPDGSLQDSARRIPTPLNLVRRRYSATPLGAIRLDSAGRVPWVVGAFLLVRRSVFRELGGFDERFRLYFEDVDLCVRLGTAGYGVVFDPELRAIHFHQAASRRSVRHWTTRQHMRSAARFYWHHPTYLVRR